MGFNMQKLMKRARKRQQVRARAREERGESGVEGVADVCGPRLGEGAVDQRAKLVEEKPC